MKLLGRGLMTNEFLLEDIFRQIRGIQRKPFPAFAVFQVPIILEPKRHILEWHILPSFNRIQCSRGVLQKISWKKNEES